MATVIGDSERLINTAPRPDSKIRESKGLFIVKEQCANTARTVPILSRNPKNMDDVDPASESHIFDAIKYALAADRSPASCLIVVVARLGDLDDQTVGTSARAI